MTETIPYDCTTVRLFRTSQEGKRIVGYQECDTFDPSEGKVTRTVRLVKDALNRIGNPRLVEITVKAVGNAE